MEPRQCIRLVPRRLDQTEHTLRGQGLILHVRGPGVGDLSGVAKISLVCKLLHDSVEYFSGPRCCGVPEGVTDATSIDTDGRSVLEPVGME